MYNLNLNWTPYDDWAREEMENQYVEKEMQNYRQRALEKFSSIVPHPEFTLSVARSIAYSYRDSIAEAEDIIEKLHLEDMEIYAIEDNFEMFKELYVKYHEESAIDDYISEVI